MLSFNRSVTRIGWIRTFRMPGRSKVSEEKPTVEDKPTVDSKRVVDTGSEDDVVLEYDLVVCDGIPNTEMYRVQFPHRKNKTFDESTQPRIRFKKNVKLMEMRLAVDTTSGSYSIAKADEYSSVSSGCTTSAKQDLAQMKKPMATDEIYEGRAFSGENPLQYGVGYIRDGKFYISPIAGSFDMHRSIAYLTQKPKGEDDGEATEESDSEVAGGSGVGQQLRVKFARPETDRQKKRREASALHREKMIANDPWIGMNVHLKGDPKITEKLNKMTPAGKLLSDDKESVEMRDLVQKAIICGKLEQLDLSRDQLMSQQRICELPDHLQIKATVMKSRVISTETVISLVSSDISRENLIDGLQKCAHLVRGVWVLKSELLFHGLAPAHSNIPGRVDEQRSEVWRDARDMALCLIDAGHRVTRATLSRCFHLNVKDAEEVLTTFGVKGNRTWQLRVEPDGQFQKSPENLPLVLEERKYWMKRWHELQTNVDRSISPKRQRRHSGKGSPMKMES